MSLKPFCEVSPESKDARIARLERELEAANSRLSDSDAKVADAYDRGYRDGRIDGDAIAQNGDVV